MNRILVTGGAGFIGSHLVERLVGQGHRVTVFDNLSSAGDESRQRSLASGATFIRGDTRDGEALADTLRGHDTVFHLAAFTDTMASNANPRVDFLNGTQAMLTLLEAMAHSEVGKLLLVSTQLVFGTASLTPYKEEAGPALPITLHGASKIACEALASAHAHLSGLAVSVARLSNIVGPRLRGGIVVDFVRKLHREPGRLEILGDGRQTRS